LVGLEDDRVPGALALAVMGFGDLPQVVALLDGVEHRLLLSPAGLVDGELGFDLGHAERVADRDHRLLEGGLVRDRALQDRLVADHLDLDLVGAEIVLVELLLQFLDLRSLVRTADAELLAHRFDEIEKSHAAVSILAAENRLSLGRACGAAGAKLKEQTAPRFANRARTIRRRP